MLALTWYVLASTLTHQCYFLLGEFGHDLAQLGLFVGLALGAFCLRTLVDLSRATLAKSRASVGASLATALERGGFDIALFDLSMPVVSGLEALKLYRFTTPRPVPVLILSALGAVDDRVTGLRAGGDDYLGKPYAFTELLARVEVLARRAAPAEAATQLQVADLSLDRLSRKVERDGEARQLHEISRFTRHEGHWVYVGPIAADA